MNIAFAADLHGNETIYNKLFDFIKKNKIDKVVLGGDLCPHGFGAADLAIKLQKGFLGWMIKKINICNAEFFVMLGNDDFRINADILENSEKEGVINYIHNKKAKLGEYSIIGYSFVNEFPFRLKDWEKLDTINSIELTDPKYDVRTVPKEEGFIEADMKKIRLDNPKKTIFVSHAPPYNTDLDILYSEKHVGSKAIREFIENNQPLLALHGHIHESFEMTGNFIDKIGDTICINPGSQQLKRILNLALIDMEDLNNIRHFTI